MIRDQRRLAAIVSADVVGYSLLMGRDDSSTLSGLKAHRKELIDPKIAEYGGRIVKTTGDGLLLEFPSVVDAVRCSVDVQREMADRNASVAPQQRIEFRIGINIGDIIIDGDDIFGDGVNVAARLQTLADPGGICVSRVVRDQVLDKLSLVFEDLGEKDVKNIVRPVGVYRIALAVESPAQTGNTYMQRLRRVVRLSSRARPVLLTVAAALGIGFAVWTAYHLFAGPSVVAPYSAQDRRMTFAVLPFQAPAGDKTGEQLAAAIYDTAYAFEEGRTVWAQVVPRRSVDQALMRHTSAKDLASTLDVHFLIRGNVAQVASGNTVDLLVADAGTERVLGTRSLLVPAGKLTPRTRMEIESAVNWLNYKGLETEVQRTSGQPIEALDVRDLSFRAYVDWTSRKQRRDEKGAYTSATDLLTRALALAPDDPLALFITAIVNLCDCVDGWSENVEVQQAIGEAALEKYLRHNPTSPTMLRLKSDLFALRGRYEESMLIAESELKRNPDNTLFLTTRAYDLLKLGRPQEALSAVNAVLDRTAGEDPAALTAAVQYELGQYELAAQMAQKAITQMDHVLLRNPRHGAVQLTLVAAEGRLGHQARANRALAEFNADVPGIQTISAMKKWMHPAADLAGYEPLFDGLRLAGVAE